jgi:hypothetical protein
MNSDPIERLSRANPMPGEMAPLSFEPVRRRMHDEPRHSPSTRASRRAPLAGRRGLAVGGVTVLAVVAAALLVVLVTGALTSASSAFAITRTGESVKISLYRFEALGALNARLAAQGIPIRAVAIIPGCTATTREVGTGFVYPPRTLQAGTSSGGASITVVLKQRPAPGDTIIIGVERSGRAQLFPHKIKGPVPSCVAAPPAHAGNGVYYPPAPPRVLKIFPTRPNRRKSH